MNEELELRALRERVAKLEAKMYYIYKHFGVSFDENFKPLMDDADKEVVALLQKGDMLGALKKYRGIHLVGPDEAKVAVDQIKAQLGLK